MTISVTASRCVAWRCLAREIETLSASLSPRNATHSRNGNKRKKLLLLVSRCVDACVCICIQGVMIVGTDIEYDVREMPATNSVERH